MTRLLDIGNAIFGLGAVVFWFSFCKDFGSPPHGPVQNDIEDAVGTVFLSTQIDRRIALPHLSARQCTNDSQRLIYINLTIETGV
jgi:hypothetical protein